MTVEVRGGGKGEREKGQMNEAFVEWKSWADSHSGFSGVAIDRKLDQEWKIMEYVDGNIFGIMPF